MVRTFKAATIKSFHYASITDLRHHVRDWLLAYNYVKQLKALRFRKTIRSHHVGTKQLWRGDDLTILDSPAASNQIQG